MARARIFSASCGERECGCQVGKRSRMACSWR
nr:MAG TPA: hypothetical protein [Caudoviricetes sp.]